MLDYLANERPAVVPVLTAFALCSGQVFDMIHRGRWVMPICVLVLVGLFLIRESRA